ncbi:hypothetical protein AYO49_02335 [Verrucomicrobiaceae bacterium SCGC AG-212-N21]|nr:hypothetical protein AYO49_02335 [Verrucomicrobiaceae bacterium SCGC AG-212-N21]
MHKLSLVLLSITLSLQAQDEAARFPFDPPKDDFRPEALLDLRDLNEKVAGESGYVKTDGKGGLLRGDGEPLRFWAVGSFVQENKPWKERPLWFSEKTEPSLAKHARFLAKHGVNLARMHTSLNPDTKTDKEAKLEAMDTKTRDYIWEFVAAMKQEGIYSMLTPYWANAFKPTEAMGLGTDDAHALLFFDPKVKAAYKKWMRELLTTPNPHTGMPLAQDPALAIIQIQNEDATLFWTIAHLKPEPLALLTQQFSEWAIKKHGNVEKVLSAWEQAKAKGDDPGAGKFELLHIFEMTKDAPPARAQRLADQTEFWSRMMFDFHREIVDYLKRECGCNQLISAGNWHTADTVRLNDALRWSYSATDIQGVNRYFPGVHDGENAAWTIKAGHVFNSRSFLTNPADWPLQLKLPVNQPFVITESSWTFPSMTASEGPLLIAAYQSLTGFDGFCWFAFGHEQWSPPMSGNGYMQNTQEKFIAAYPDCLGQFPAAALIVRKGYVKQGEPVIHESRSLDDLWQRKLPVVAESGSYNSGKADPRAFFVGPVEVEYDAKTPNSRIADISAFVDEGSVRSNTGEHEFNTKDGWFTLNAPCAQGVVALFKNRRDFTLADFALHSDNDYGTCTVVSLDGKPLRDSAKVLVQAGTNALPKGWKDAPAPADANPSSKKGNKAGAPPKDLRVIENVGTGRGPWMVEKVKMKITITNPNLSKATALDPNGYALRTVEVSREGDKLTVKLPEDALHVILEP